MLSEDIIISVSQVSKVYHSYDDPKQRLLQLLDRKKRSSDFWALSSLSFDIKKGSTVGVIGRNGSGKSTLLQIIAGTVTPTTGTIKTKGRIVALLELGSGFNPEFSGRENVFLNGAMFGISRKEMEKKYLEIESFADIGEHIDKPVKTYSSGMFARLAFSVAINMDPDILIVDEILAVGDLAFQAKCVAKMRKMKDQGLTLLFVSHSVDALKSLCNEAILLEKGKLTAIGTSEEITNRYLAAIRQEMNEVQEGEETSYNIVETESSKEFKYGTGEVYFKNIQVLNEYGELTKAFEYGHTLNVRCEIAAKKDVENINISFLVRDITGIDLFGTTMFDERVPLVNMIEGETREIEFQFPIMLRAGSYSISVAVNTVSSRDYTDVYLYEQIDAAASFEVIRVPSRPVHYKFHVPVNIKQYEIKENSHGK